MSHRLWRMTKLKLLNPRASILKSPFLGRNMAQPRSAKASLSHEERTATEPRNADVHPATLSQIHTVNDRTRTYRFTTKDPNGIKFLPGQWLDVHVPGIKKAGGFTITSPPRDAQPQRSTVAGDAPHTPFFELAIQKSPENPPAAWLWQPEEYVLGKEVLVRVGGSFVWPPPGIERSRIRRAVFIAGGVGINPLISILSHIRQESPDLQTHLLYSTRLPSRNPEPDSVLFLPRILDLFRPEQVDASESNKHRLRLFVTGAWDDSDLSFSTDFVDTINRAPGAQSDTQSPIRAQFGRIDEAGLDQVIGEGDERSQTVFYVCGPPEMTDDIVAFLKGRNGIQEERVLCEKWW